MKKDTLTQQQVTLLLDLVQNALEDNLTSKSTVKNENLNLDLWDVFHTLEDMS